MLVPVPIVLGKPGEALVNRVSNAIGVIFEPHRIRREADALVDAAEAEVKADIIRAEGRMKISEIEARGLQRMVYEEGKNQENIESITQKAIPHLKPDAKPEDLDQDFVRYLFDKAKLVSNEEMQAIWAKILAGEANNSGAFSRRTMDIVSQLSSEDADLFLRYCSNVWVLGDITPLMRDAQSTDEGKPHQLSFEELTHLADAGLINYEPATGFARKNFPKKVRVRYYDCFVDLEFANEEKNQISLGPTILTRTGLQLIRILAPKESKDAFEWGLKSMIDQGILVSIAAASKGDYPREETDNSSF